MNEVKTTGCSCTAIGDLAVLDMVHDQVQTEPLVRVKHRGEPWWWLSLYTCRECGQPWLLASEERQNDVYCLKRLDAETADRIVQEDIWPSDFDRYETLLAMGRDAGHTVRWGDIYDSSLPWTITDLARERPGISVSELASLLNTRQSDIEKLAQAAVRSSGVVITFD